MGIELIDLKALKSTMLAVDVVSQWLSGKFPRRLAAILLLSIFPALPCVYSQQPSGEDKAAKALLAYVQQGSAVAGAYVGDDACYSCHQQKAESYHRTAHFHTSSLPSQSSIHGNFNPESNVLRTANPDLFFIMESTGGQFSEKGVMRRSPSEILERSEAIGVVIGSGRKGQTYLYWDEDKLFQLPVSYWVELGEWVNSPGYVDGTANFDRPIAPRCLECHASSFESHASAENAYEKSSLVLGLTCEKCHGPGGEHVARYRSKTPPTSVAASAIINPARLPRERQMDVCALCHAGIGTPLSPPLSFVPGDELDHHLTFPALDPKAHIDVHGSQVQLLKRSRCYRESTSMTCTTCHDVHTPQRDPAAFSEKCLACHKVENCGSFAKLGHRIDRECATCHMPLQETAQIVISGLNGRSLQPKVRNHQIAIYPDVRLP
ncbi:MAG TPA: multiheme c-type cytochrome [Lacunisphaera sp.]|jgi:hypothetical protein